LALVRELTAAPDLDGWTITERLKDLAPLEDRLWLMIDDEDHGCLLDVTFVGPVWNVNAKNKPSRFASTARVKILSVANLSSVRLAWISLAATGSSSQAQACGSSGHPLRGVFHRLIDASATAARRLRRRPS
jgi:hypothetical protein